MEQQEQQSFEQVLAKYASEHNATGTDKTTIHTYGPLYSGLFAPLRCTARRVLEIGVYSGASVLAMADFFAGALVTGIDINLTHLRFGVDHPRITYRQLDGTHGDTPRLIGDQWDVVLDDASHRPADQVAAFRSIGATVRPGGIYVIEDIDGTVDGGQKLRSQLEEARSDLGFTRLEWHDLRQVKGRFDDIVAVLYA